MIERHCKGKMKFPTAADARKYVKETTARHGHGSLRKVRPYECDCGMWHLTSQSKTEQRRRTGLRNRKNGKTVAIEMRRRKSPLRDHSGHREEACPDCGTTWYSPVPPAGHGLDSTCDKCLRAKLPNRVPTADGEE